MAAFPITPAPTPIEPPKSTRPLDATQSPALRSPALIIKEDLEA